VASADLVNRAVEAYGGSGFTLPERQDLIRPSEPGSMVIGTERVSLDLLRHDNRTLLIQYLTVVRRQRGLGKKDAVVFRAADLVALANVLDLTDDDLEQELLALAGMTGNAARRTAQLLVLTGLCVLAAGGATLGSRSSVRTSDLMASGAGAERVVSVGTAPSTAVADRSLRSNPDRDDGHAGSVERAEGQGSSLRPASLFTTHARIVSDEGEVAPPQLFEPILDGTRTQDESRSYAVGDGAISGPGFDDGAGPTTSDSEAARKKADEQDAQKKKKAGPEDS